MNENGYDAASLVCLPRYEYARLVAAKAKLDIVETCVVSLDSFDCMRMFDALFAPELMAEEAE